MKKLIAFFIVLLTATTLFAGPIQLGSFPVGKWLDPNYDAVWDFASDNIRILSPSGKVLYDFSGKTIQDFKVFMEGTQPGISFSCVESGKSYRFLKPLTNTDVVMEIERKSLAKYSVTMKKQ
jgi:hypothetical protein